MSLLSVIVPCYNEEENVACFYEELMKNRPFFEKEGLEVEILYIDDGSRDGTVREVKKLRERDGRVRLISFSRNFGKEAAIYAGLEKSKGDYVVMMDADLQDPPSLLPEMFSHIQEGYDSVATRRVSRKGEPPIRSFFSKSSSRKNSFFSTPPFLTIETQERQSSPTNPGIKGLTSPHFSATVGSASLLVIFRTHPYVSPHSFLSPHINDCLSRQTL